MEDLCSKLVEEDVTVLTVAEACALLGLEELRLSEREASGA